MAKILVGIGIVAAAGVVAISAAVISENNSATRSTPVVADASLADTAKPAVQVSQDTRAMKSQRVGVGMAAMQQAAEANKYLFVFFYKDDDEQTRAMRRVFDATMPKVADRAEFVLIDTTDPLEREVVEKFGASRSPMPLVLALAPSGAITGGFPLKFNEAQLMGAFASPSLEKCIKALQGGKLVLVSVQNAMTRFNSEAMQGVQALKADARFTKATEIVTVDPRDAAEAGFLKKLQIDPKIDEAVTVFLAPPGRLIARFKGATNKNALVAAIQRAASGSSCGPGSGPNCCPPRKKP